MILIISHSAKGGVGATFLCAQLALCMAERGLRVAAVDFTYQDSLKLHFGLLPNQFTPGFREAEGEPLAISDVGLISAYSERRDNEFIDIIQRDGLPDHAVDIMIADIAASDRELVELLYPHADLHISTLLPDPVALATLTRVGGDKPLAQLEKTALVLNKLDDRRKLSRHSHRFIREVFEDQLIGTIRRDEAVAEALAMFEPLSKVAPNSVVLPDIQLLTDVVLARCGSGVPSATAGNEPSDKSLRRAG